MACGGDGGDIGVDVAIAFGLTGPVSHLEDGFLQVCGDCFDLQIVFDKKRKMSEKNDEVKSINSLTEEHSDEIYQNE